MHDIDATQAYYESIGIGPWQEYPPLTEYTDLDVPNPDAFLAMQYRVVDLDNVQLQLCQPPELDCPQRRFLDTHGEGVFHLGFEHDLDAAVEQAGRARAGRADARAAPRRQRLRLLRHRRRRRGRARGPQVATAVLISTASSARPYRVVAMPST